MPSFDFIYNNMNKEINKEAALCTVNVVLILCMH